MKKILKSFTALILIAAVMFSLCSCKALDELREIRASYREDGSVIFNGAVYKKLSESVIFPNTDYSAYIFLTDEEIPLLLTPFMGKSGFLGNDGIFLYVQGDFWNDTPDITYCREDKYNEIQEEINNPVFTNYVIYYSEYNPEEFIYEEKMYTLSEGEINALNTVVSDENNLSDFSTEYVYGTVSVYLTTKNCLTVGATFEIAEAKGNYFICVYDENSYEGFTYKVPEEYKQTIAGLMQYADDGYDYEDYFMGLSA